MTDELEQRMRAADPVPASAPVDPAGSPQAQTLVERIMTDQIVPLDAPSRPGRGRWIAVAAAAAALVVGVAVVAAGGDDDGATSTLALSVPGGDAMQMCIAPDATILADGVDVAFEGTVTAVDGDVATLTAEGKISAIILGFMPLGLGAVMYTMNPDYMGVLFTETLGKVLLGAGTVSALIGFAWMKKCITIEV